MNYKLLYVWINDNDRIINKEFHFSKKYSFSFDVESTVLSMEKNNSYIDDFYSDKTMDDDTKPSKSTIDFSAIVGNNAVGKTTLLNFIYKYALTTEEIVSEPLSEWTNHVLSMRFDIQYIMIYLDLDSENEQLYAIPCNVNVNVNRSDRITKVQELPGCPPKSVYLTNTFNYSDYVNGQHSYDDYNLATGNLMNPRIDARKVEFTTDPIIRYEHQEILRQSAVIKAVDNNNIFRDTFKRIGLNIPKSFLFLLKKTSWDKDNFPGINFDLEPKNEVGTLKDTVEGLTNKLNLFAKRNYSDPKYPDSNIANLKIYLCSILIQSIIVSISKVNAKKILKMSLMLARIIGENFRHK